MSDGAFKCITASYSVNEMKEMKDSQKKEKKI